MADKVTIQDIADALGLSRNTVSKAINNTGVLAEATRDKILRKAVEMGYKQFSYVKLPDAGKENGFIELSSEALSKEGVISFLIGHNLGSSHFASTMLDRLQRELSGQGYSSMTYRVTKEHIKSLTLPSGFSPPRSDGILCIEIFDPDYAELICSQGKPTLFVDGPSAYVGKKLQADLLLMDNRTELSTFVAQMIEKGITSFGFIGEIYHCISFYERYLALRETLMRHSIPFDKTYLLSTTSGRENWRETYQIYTDYLADRLKGLSSLPQVFLCTNDFIAIDALKCFRKLGIRVPEDVLLCGFDDSPESRVITPRLTTVHIHSQIMGYTAASLLLSRIREPSLNLRTVHTETTLHLRESTRLP